MSGMLAMAPAMDSIVIAEGIEDGEQAEALRALGGDVARGRRFGRAALAWVGISLLSGPLDGQLAPPTP